MQEGPRQKEPITPQLHWFGLWAALLTGPLHLLTAWLGGHGIFIVVAIGFWAAFVGSHVRQDRRWLVRWGFRRDNLGPAFLVPTLLFALATCGFGLYAWSRGALQWPRQTWYLLALYPLWGIIQQFLIQALIVQHLSMLPPFRNRVALTLLGAALFGVVHIPDPLLVAATFGVGLLFVPCYLRWRNLWPLGLYHGWLATFFYLWVLGQNPWLQEFGNKIG